TRALAELEKQWGAGGNAEPGRSELATRVQAALEPQKKPPPAPPIAPQPEVRIDVPVTMGRVIQVPPRPLWLKILPVAAVIAIGIVAWRVMAQRKTPIAAAASEHAPPAPAVAPPAPPTPMPKAPSVTPLPKTPPPVPTPPPVVPEAALEPV